MTPDPEPGSGCWPDTSAEAALPLFAFPLLVDHFYPSLMQYAPSAEAGLGGRLLYAGNLDREARALMVAANIAGAASLAAAADAAAGKQAIRAGVADFLVTDLDEALRILKNEIRKREAVAVCVAAPPEAIEREMLERGVLPDLVRGLGLADGSGGVRTFGGDPMLVEPLSAAAAESLLTWSVDEAPAQWLPRLDALAMDCLALDESPSAQIARRWLRFAPRYCSRRSSIPIAASASRPSRRCSKRRGRMPISAPR